MACETGIAPSVLLEQSDRMLFTMVMYLRHRAQQGNRKA